MASEGGQVYEVDHLAQVIPLLRELAKRATEAGIKQ
jgi:hypothetical protein